MKVISDKSLMEVPIKDSGEKLVNLKKICSEIMININPQTRKTQKLSKKKCYLREGVVKRIGKAQQPLPKGYHLMIFEIYRPQIDDFRTSLVSLQGPLPDVSDLLAAA